MLQIQAESGRVPESLHIPLLRPPSVCLFVSASLRLAPPRSRTHRSTYSCSFWLRDSACASQGGEAAAQRGNRWLGTRDWHSVCACKLEKGTRDAKEPGEPEKEQRELGRAIDWGRDREGRAKNGTRGSPALPALLARGGRPPHLVLQAPCVLLPDLRAGRADGVCVCVCVLSE